MTKIQRVKKLCKWLMFIDYADNDKELAEKLGYTRSSFSQIMNEKVPLSDKFVNTLANSNDNINIDWINDGKGEMLRTGENLQNNSELQFEIKQLKEENSELKSKIVACQEEIILLMRGGSKSKAS